MQQSKPSSDSSSRSGARSPGGFSGRRPGGGARRGGRDDVRDREYEQKTLALDRVTRVTAGGKRMRFRAAVLIGDKKGKVGFGVAKGADVAIALDKAARLAKKRVFKIPMVEQSLPHAVSYKFGAAQVLIKPAPAGTGLKCGGAVRELLELGGVPNAVSKILGSNNKLNIAKATMMALRQLRAKAAPAAAASAPESPTAV